jgi:TIGR03009 family protein
MTVVLRRVSIGLLTVAAMAAASLSASGQNPPAGPQPAVGPQPAIGPQQAGAPQQGPVRQGPQQAGPQRQQPGPGAIQQNPAVPREPSAPFTLTPPQEEYLNQILNYWEFKSREIERFRCRFTRWEYDPVFGPKDPFTAKSESNGVIMYSKPDKGLFKVEKIYQYVAPATPGDSPRYEEAKSEVGEHWVCDGASVFEYNHQQKKLIQYSLPPNMAGNAIANSPLPFIFGANAQQIKERFWMRVITPREAQGEYWLEAYPKRQADAANYQKIEIILDENDYLPKAIQVFDPTYHVRLNPKRTAFMFESREANWNMTLQRLNLFHKEFYEPVLPSGWKKETQRYDQPAQAPPQQARNVPANRAR